MRARLAFALAFIALPAFAQGLTGNWSGTYTFSIQLASCQNKTFTWSGNASLMLLQSGKAVSGRIDLTNYTLFSSSCNTSIGEVTHDLIGAISWYEAALHMYTPGSPLVEQAAQKLWAIGERFERADDPVRALVAYRSLRSSFYAVRGLTRPGTGWIARCDGKIAALVQLQARTHQGH